jgi:hypothetical protein
MIRHFDEISVMEPESGGHFQWGAALGAGLIPGVLLLLAPRGSPWAGISFFSDVIMGRPLPPGLTIALPLLCIVHLLIAEIYGLIISACVTKLTQERAVLMGGVVGLILYSANLAIVSLAWPAWRGNEIGVVFTHIIFGLIAGGAYRGLLRRKAMRAHHS